MNAPEKFGDFLLWTWGEAVKNGDLLQIFEGGIQGISDDGNTRPPHTHSDPTVARLLAAESRTQDKGVALMVDKEIRIWATDDYAKLWADIAREYYAAPSRPGTESVAKKLNVSPRTVEGCRSNMRRYIVIAAYAAGVGDGQSERA